MIWGQIMLSKTSFLLMVLAFFWVACQEAPVVTGTALPTVMTGSAGRYRSVVMGCSPKSRDSSSTMVPLDMLWTVVLERMGRRVADGNLTNG